MRTYFSKLSIALLGVVLLAGCIGTASQSGSNGNKATSNTNKTSGDPVADAKVYDINEEAAAGDIVHEVTFVEALATIPKSYTAPEWEILAEDLPADKDFQWVHVKGKVTNNTKQTQTVNSTSVYVIDDAGNEYDVSTDTTIYIPEDTSPVYLTLQPTQSVEWEGYFMVPQSAKGLTLVANDLSFLPKAAVKVDLGL